MKMNDSQYQMNYTLCNIASTAENYLLFMESEVLTIGDESRYILLVVFSALIVAVTSGNVATLYVAHTKQNYMTYKCCLISLALSDLLLGNFTALVNICNLCTRFMEWLLGEELCRMTTYVQTATAIANSLTLTCVALDRYQAVMSNSPGGRWQPNRWMCLFIMTALWLVSCSIAVPMYNSYDIMSLWVLHFNAEGEVDRCYHMTRCLTRNLESSGNYYVGVFAVIFIPLLCVFVALHGVIAKFVWLKRKPQSPSIHSVARNNNNFDNSTNSPSLNFTKRTHMTTISVDSNSNNSNKNKVVTTSDIKMSNINQKQHRSVHRERNIRTFRRIIIMMLACFLLRMPSWIATVFFTNNYVPDEEFWIGKYIGSMLNVLCSALNPLLYCFCNETLLFFRKTFGWLKRMMCGTYCPDGKKNFFNMNLVTRRRSTCGKDVRPVIFHVPPMVPRGPYSESEKQAGVEPAKSVQHNKQMMEADSVRDKKLIETCLVLDNSHKTLAVPGPSYFNLN